MTLKESLEQGRLYDYVANNYTCMSRDELKDIILECIGTVYDNTGEEKYVAYQHKVLENLIDRGTIE